MKHIITAAVAIVLLVGFNAVSFADEKGEHKTTTETKTEMKGGDEHKGMDMKSEKTEKKTEKKETKKKSK
jgi:hypothetical protein